MLSVASSGIFNSQIGSELPEFVGGPSVYAYALSMPTMNTDPTGEVSLGQIWKFAKFAGNLCMAIVKGVHGDPDAPVIPPAQDPRFNRPPIVEPAPPTKGPGPQPPPPPPRPPISQ